MGDTRGKTVKLYFEQGHHEGIIYADLINWTGYLIAAPRTSLTELYQLKEAKGAGIYFLFSDEDKKVYVGETVNGVNRLRDHDAKKDFWNRLVLVQATDLHLTKTHCSYLEHRCAQIIDKESLYTLENTNSLKDYTGALNRSAINDMEYFLENIQFVLPAMGIDILKPVTYKKTDKNIKASFVINTKTVQGEVYLQDEQLILKKGSIGNKNVKPSLYESIKNRRDLLIQKGVFKIVGNQLIVQEDFKASSLSTAACFLTGYPISGPQHWKLKGTKKSYKEWEEEQSTLSE